MALSAKWDTPGSVEQPRSGLAATFSVAIVSHNTRDLLRACIDSSLAGTPGEVIVVDNASTDGSVEMVRSTFPCVRLISRDDNSGYGAAANLALAAARYPFVLVVNSDTHILPGALDALGAYLMAHPSVAIAGPRLVNPDGSLQPSCYPFPTALHLLIDVAGLVGVIGRIPLLRERYLRTWSHNDARSVPWVVGAALAIRKDVVQSIGGFDESYHMYFEEVDLSYRLGAGGWETHYVPDASIIHVGGASASQRRTEMQYRFCASRMRFIQQHYNPVRVRVLLTLLRMLTRYMIARDSVRLRVTRNRHLRKRLSNDIAAWHMVLAGGS